MGFLAFRRDLVALMAAVAVPASAHAGLIYVDHFLTGGDAASGQYTAGSILPGQNPTIANASGAWAAGGDQTSASVNIRVNATGLTYPNLPVAGGSTESFRTGSGAGGTFAFTRNAANNADTTIDASEILYFSGLISFTSGAAAGLSVDFENRDPFGIGFNTAGKPGIFTNTGAFQQVGTDAYAPGVYLIVGRMIPNNGVTSDPETVQLLAINPTNNVEPGGALVSHSVNVWGNATTTDTIEKFGVMMSKSPTGVIASVDEIRYGTTYADVVPLAVPEPASLGILALGAMALLHRRQ